jgi:peptidoglycan/xylan/chitin deacetylase (PgdA/CDA1 family)
MSKLRIIMYHYVRDPERSRYPRIKVRSTKEFRNQLDYLAAHFTPVTAQQVIAACRGEYDLPPNALWLTFDDGYLDHYVTVFPLLHDRGWQGSFFAPARAVLEEKLLDVNKIHLLLGAVDNINKLVSEIRSEIGPTFEQLWSAYATADLYDPAEVVFVKKVLQQAVPQRDRTRIVDNLFARYVSVDERAIASEFYMSPDQIRLMVRSGMFFGSHGYDHSWMNSLTAEEQVREVRLSLDFLNDVGATTNNWVMCYPYGAYNQSLLQTLKRFDCSVGLTTQSAVADVARDTALELPRLDTNEFPTAK